MNNLLGYDLHSLITPNMTLQVAPCVEKNSTGRASAAKKSTYTVDVFGIVQDSSRIILFL